MTEGGVPVPAVVRPAPYRASPFTGLDPADAPGTPTPVPGPDPAYLQPGTHPVVPYTVGQSAEAATAALQQAGYSATTQQVASTQPAGQVVGETPQGNAAPGTRVTLLVSRNSSS